VFVYSGSSGSIIRIHDCPYPAYPAFQFGAALSSVGDINLDGIDDYAIGAPSLGGPGMLFAYSGADGSMLWNLTGIQLWRLGSSVARLGDVDFDGVPDLVSGAPLGGAVYVISGTGAVLYMAFSSINGSLGQTVAGIGDVDGDGAPDIAAGEPLYTDPVAKLTYVGRVRVLSGATGAFLSSSVGDHAMDRYGTALSRCGDLDGD